MGRPLNKKYFGNRNIGSGSTTADNGIGGGAVESVSAGTVGSFVVNDTYRNFPTLTATAPTIPGGVTALLTPVYELETVTYASGGQTNADYVAGLSTSITGLGGGAIVYITEVANKVTAVDVTTAGTNRGEFRRGDFTGAGTTTFQVLQAPNAGTDLQITCTFRLKRVEVAEQGSGYVSAPSLSWGGHTFTTQTAPSAQVVTMLTDSGIVGTTGNQENAIRMTAYLTGGSASEVDIIRQVSTDRYKVTDGTRTGIVKLAAVASGSLVAGQANIVATDASSGTYYVTKLTAHKATLTRGTGTVYTTGAAYPWTFGTADATYCKIPNA